MCYFLKWLKPNGNGYLQIDCFSTFSFPSSGAFSLFEKATIDHLEVAKVLKIIRILIGFLGLSCKYSFEYHDDFG